MNTILNDSFFLVIKKRMLFFIFLITIKAFSQSAPITIDGNFDDWTPNLTTFVDIPETINGIDILEIQVTNDENFLFIKVKTNTEFVLTDTNVSQSLNLQIDADNDSATGYEAQIGFGSELGISFSNRNVYYNISNPPEIFSLSSLTYRSAPAYSSNQFEIAIARNAIPDGINPLFSSETIKILFQNLDNNEDLPNVNDVLSYTFDETPVAVYTTIEIAKENTDFIRTMSYNTLNNGLTDPNRVANFERILSVINPDVIAFQECWTVTENDVKLLLDNILPIGGSGWNVVRGGFNITATRWNILQTWDNLFRQYPVLIDLPNTTKNLLFTNAHLKSGNFDETRQQQADEYASFILGIKNSGELPTNTPFIYTGDLNMYGLAQPLTTLLSGEIQDVGTYGNGAPLDWNNTAVTSNLALQTDNRMAYTWREDISSYAPGKLDYLIFSDAVMQVEKAFVLQTEVMSQDRLFQYGLNQNDTGSASDHFPIVVDFTLVSNLSVSSDLLNNIKVYPNPVLNNLIIDLNNNQFYEFAIYNTFGNLIYENKERLEKTTINMETFLTGVYLIRIKNNNQQKSFKIIKN